MYFLFIRKKHKLSDDDDADYGNSITFPSNNTTQVIALNELAHSSCDAELLSWRSGQKTKPKKDFTNISDDQDFIKQSTASLLSQSL